MTIINISSISSSIPLYNVKISENNIRLLTGSTIDYSNGKESRHATFEYDKITEIDNDNENNMYTIILKRIVKCVSEIIKLYYYILQQ